jgi:amino acid permease
MKRGSSIRSPNGSPSRVMPLLNPGRHMSNGRDDVMGETRFAVITTVIIVSSYFVAITVSSLERTLAYVGSTGSTCISFILPGLFYYKISAPDSLLGQSIKDDDDENGDSESEYDEALLGRVGIKINHWKKDLLRTLSLALAIYGLIVMVVCFITNTFFIVAH